jgi:biotin carboxyl carrier protein
MKKTIKLNEELIDVDVIEESPRFILFSLDGEEYAVRLENNDDYRMNLSYKANNKTVVNVDPHFVVDGIEFNISAPKFSRNKSKSTGSGQMTSPMPGKILKIFVKDGDPVKAGTPILVMEAMKMEHTIKATVDGKIDKILYKEGDQVTGGVELVKLC